MKELQDSIIEKVRRCDDSRKLQAVDKILSSTATGRTLLTYTGFGEEHTAADWARRLGLPRNTLWRYLQKGLAIELIAKMRDCNYPAENHKSTTRKPRQGARMEETRQAMTKLLEDSGYPVDSDEAITISHHYGTRHLVAYKGESIGQYDYKTGSLHLGDGEGLRIYNPFVEEPKVIRNALGVWEVHPNTRQELVARLVNNVDIPEEDYPTF